MHVAFLFKLSLLIGPIHILNRLAGAPLDNPGVGTIVSAMQVNVITAKPCGVYLYEVGPEPVPGSRRWMPSPAQQSSLPRPSEKLLHAFSYLNASRAKCIRSFPTLRMTLDCLTPEAEHRKPSTESRAPRACELTASTPSDSLAPLPEDCCPRLNFPEKSGLGEHRPLTPPTLPLSVPNLLCPSFS
jgi:hypothetical protein